MLVAVAVIAHPTSVPATHVETATLNVDHAVTTLATVQPKQLASPPSFDTNQNLGTGRDISQGRSL